MTKKIILIMFLVLIFVSKSEAISFIDSIDTPLLACFKCDIVNEARLLESETIGTQFNVAPTPLPFVVSQAQFDTSADVERINALSTNVEVGNKKSAVNAMLMSAVFPGSGQMYLGKTTRGGVFMAADIVSLFALFRFNKEKNIAIDNFQMYAYANAGLRKGVSNDIYSIAHNYKSSNEYNKFIEMQARNWYLIIQNNQAAFDDYMERNRIKPEDSWNWESDFHLSEYRSIRTDKQSYEIYENFAFGALLINRVISVIDSAIQTGRVNRSGQVYAMPDQSGRGISLNYEYKF